MTEAAGLSIRLDQDHPIPLNIDLAVDPGEILAIVGPSGSGKSTCLRAVAGLHKPTSGHIVCNGATWLDTAAGINLDARRRRVGLVFQSYALFPHLTTLENVLEALQDRPPERRRDEALALLARIRLEGLEERLPRQLSGGQQQRVAVARALARRPDVLLLDEPFSAVDRVTRQRLQRELAELRHDLEMPILLVTHDLDEAARLADRICVIHHGRSLQTASPETVMARPDSPLVARLVNLRNVFSGVVTGHRVDAGITLLEWQGRRIEARLSESFPPGAAVTWCIPADSIIVHRRDRPSKGERENPVSGIVREAVRLGQTTELVIVVGDDVRQPFHLEIPTHVARRNGIEVGAAIGFSLRAEAVHLMTPEPDGADQ
ncbi:MAG: ABC transporter ATP-binding protein [Proteobacteria bacterium]|nr:ABC transporter ATP-binding protein [Pseudomonadota bacterium]